MINHYVLSVTNLGISYPVIMPLAGAQDEPCEYPGGFMAGCQLQAALAVPETQLWFPDQTDDHQ